MTVEIGDELYYRHRGRVKKATVQYADKYYIRLSNGITYSRNCVGVLLYHTKQKAEASAKLVIKEEAKHV